MLEIGSFLSDRYEILSKVGAGGMSDVYKAKDHILSRFVAIKVLKQEFSEDSSFVTKFRAEAQSAAGLEHPNIVNIYDVGSENGLYYIVMEYVEGITLKTYIEKKGQLSFKESASIAIQVARGIEAAHNKNIIHRDIKPQNIIISTDGKVKVTDFGIAKATSSNTISSDVMGSVHYASPEQARNGFVDGRSDIYSLGIVMFEMVTGRVPFDGDTTVAVALQHLQEEIARPSIYAPDLPISFEKIILKCTQKTPDRRYQTIEELLTDIRRSLAHPDEDFVTIAPLVDGGKTKVISPEELDKIKEGRGVAEDLNDDDTDADNGDEYADDEEDIMAIGLAKRYEDTYLLENYNKYLVVGSLDVNFTHFNEQELKDIVYQPWQGSNFSKRIWNNYTKVMPEVLTDVMFRSTALGYSYNRVERMLRDKFKGIVKSNIHRLVVTEMGHVAEEATAKFYEDSGIEQYQYLATLETHTCDVCAHLDERIFNVKDKKEGVNYPLIHPYCRCSTCPYIKDLPDIPTRWYRDPITGKSKWTRNMTFEQWKKATTQKPYTPKTLGE